MTDVAVTNRTPSAYLPAGEKGLVYLLAKGAINTFSLSPGLGGELLNTSHTVTIKYLDPAGSGISGASVSLALSSDSVNYPISTTKTTDGSGAATWTYNGGSTAGRDTIVATVTSSGQTCPPVAKALVDWAVNIVTIGATDSSAAEPSTAMGIADTGTFTLTRTGSTAAPLDVYQALGGTAAWFWDYNVPDFPITILAGHTAATFDVTPVYDELSEISETVVAGIVPSGTFDYAVGATSEDTVNISSTTTDTITISVTDSSCEETNSNPGSVQLHRAGTSGNAVIALAITGTASYGADYTIGGLNTDGTATILNGNQNVTLTIDPIPDSRYEGSESVIITILDSPDYSYAPGSPLTQTINITDDDTDQIPSDGWAITDLVTLGGEGGRAFSINTISDGSGGWRGQIAGDLVNSTANPPERGVFWDNGVTSLRSIPSAWSGYSDAWSFAYGINDAAIVVGLSGYYTGQYYQYGCYWAAGQTSPTLLPTLSTDLSLDNYATAINNSGNIIVGNQKASGGNTHAVMWVPDGGGSYASGLTELGDIGFGDRYSYATAINYFGEVVGKSQPDGYSIYHAFRSDASSLIPAQLTLGNDMGTATFDDSHSSEANDINITGELVGASRFPGNVYYAAYKAPGSPKNQGWYNLGVLGQGTANAGTNSIALGIGENGLIVGASYVKVSGVNQIHAFAVSNAGDPGSQTMLDLNDVSYVWTGSTWQTATANGWQLMYAEKVNFGNWIVGYGFRSSHYHAFLLTPR